ncbi:hypothetical protein C3486_26080 [Streptomyces sp. Ru73]|uniref:hypothetical protein n=1 Tax=Streptomyces sp. Ru73 TaxID=2080748 RepID=UPI000CDD5013|nr:hypothetical protein [Streptomyces sp. Ru73]POX37892.1 hypothetical protein C3486_26080 [Streptomyces sp. Ru73]
MTTDMDSAVLSGTIGLAGAVVGAAATFAGVVYQQRHQERTAREARRSERAEAATEAILAELLAIQALARRSEEGLRAEELQERKRSIHDHVATIIQVSHRLTEKRLRERVQNNAFFVLLSPPGDDRSRLDKRLAMLHLCEDSVLALGAHLRGDPPPEVGLQVRRLHARWPEFLGSTWYVES